MFDMSMSPEMNMRVTPALLNLAHLLTLPSMALHQMVQQELAENPALEELETYEPPCVRCGGPIIEGVCLRCAYDSAGEERLSPLAEDSEFDALLFVAAPPSMAEGLLADLYASLPESEHAIAQTLVGNLDDQGFLADEVEHIATTLNVSIERVHAVLQALREVGPPGIAARDTRECLLAQLDALAAQGVTCAYAREIIADRLEDLGAHRYTRIARQLQISTDQVRAVRDFIQQHLWPYPAQAIVSDASIPDRVCYRRPDLAIVQTDDDTFRVEIMHSPRRMLRLNPLYQELARRSTTLEDEERSHVQEYIARARTFLANLRQRESTLQRIGEAIVARQEAFLRQGIRFLAPMTRTEIAAELGLHESTVSRATAHKSVLLPQLTLMPLSEFFVAARGVQDVLRELINNEAEPLSDADLSRLLKERGYTVARRTVAKYREQMQIPPSNMR